MMLDDPSALTVACLFEPSIADAVGVLSLHEARRSALRRLEDLVDLDCEDCLASAAVFAEDPPACDAEDPDQDRPVRTSHAVVSPSRPKTIIDSYAPWDPAEAVMTASGLPTDDRPCKLCEDAQHQDDMILCDRCNACYHRDCARSSGGSQVHDGPWFCVQCKGHLTLHGAEDITQDWPLMDHLWTGWLPGDPDEADRITSLARLFRAHGHELQI